MSDSYIAPIEVDSDGDLILVFPDELLAAMDWSEGDTLKWRQNEDGSWTLTKNENSTTE